jgi:hypothetical protein
VTSVNRHPLRYQHRQDTAARRLNPAGFSVGKATDVIVLRQKLRASRRAISGRQGSWPRKLAKEAADLLAKAILELAATIEATDAKVKKMNKSG